MPNRYGLAVVDRCVVCTLRNEKFFCSLPDAVLKDFDKLKISRVFPKGAWLFAEGQTPKGIYVLCQGEVNLSTTSLDGRTLTLRVAHAGEILGLGSCIAGLSYDVTAEAHISCQASFLKREDFLHFLHEHGAACLRAAEYLSAQVQDAMAVIGTLGRRHHASEKLAKFLLTQDAEGTNRMPLALTHQEIADILGTARETVTRTLKQFKRSDSNRSLCCVHFCKDTATLPTLQAVAALLWVL
jgi:CRP/FNR family transcriptional regulator